MVQNISSLVQKGGEAVMANVEWLFIDRASRAAINPGDFVSAEAGGLPIYQVVDIADGRVWVRDEATHRDHILPVDHLRWRMLQPHALAH